MEEESKSTGFPDCWSPEKDSLTVIPSVRNPKDATGRWTAAVATGPCGDTMYIELKIENEQVVDSYFWGNGCVHSQACGRFAAQAAVGKTVEELSEISPEFIMANLKELPLEQGHCAQLAHDTLMEVLHQYFSNWRTSQNIEGLR